MLLGILTLLVALSISVIAAYYSIVGLTAIFAAAFLPIVLMGSVLEVGKLLATVWLHQNWNRAPRAIKYYLTTAVVVLMFITSMGVFGFLSKSHIEQSAVGGEQLAQMEVIDEKLVNIDSKINRWTQDIERLNQGGQNIRVDNLIKLEQDRIDQARKSIEPQIKAQNDKIPLYQAQADKEIKQQEKRLSAAQSRSKADIEQANKRLAVLDKDVEAYTKQGTVKGGVFTTDTDNVARGKELRKEQKPERDALNKQIAQAKKNELSIASVVQREITKINSKLADQIAGVEKAISEIRKSIQPTIELANKNIQKHTADAGTGSKEVEAKIEELENKIADIQPEKDKLRDAKFQFEKKYRQFEAEVGPVKYIAELIYGEADRSLLEDAVRWVIIIIVAVFDPLAVCLVLAGTMTIGWSNQERAIRKGVAPTKTKSISSVVQTHYNDNKKKIEELEMELSKHNKVLEDLEKLLDDNLGNINPAEYKKLQDDYAHLQAEKTALEQAINLLKTENDGLIDKIVSTESERDELKEAIAGVEGGIEGQQKRIEELLQKVVELEKEIDRRDQVVLKMAEKYQLVEKDEFADSLVGEATNPKK
jgi:chromosome segregation ATPase